MSDENKNFLFQLLTMLRSEIKYLYSEKTSSTFSKRMSHDISIVLTDEMTENNYYIGLLNVRLIF